MIKHVTIFLCMLFVFIGVSAQTKTLTGTVKDANQEPLIGVSIVEKGTSNGTITDLDGNFSIKVNPKSSLVFSYVGYAPQTIVVGSQDHINVVMREDNKELEELVVVGYGVQKKSDVTGSISSVSANDIKGLATTLMPVLLFRERLQACRCSIHPVLRVRVQKSVYVVTHPTPDSSVRC